MKLNLCSNGIWALVRKMTADGIPKRFLWFRVVTQLLQNGIYPIKISKKMGVK